MLKGALINLTFSFFYRKIQEALEKHNRENFKKRETEKRKVDEATEKAKSLMRVKRKEDFLFMAILLLIGGFQPISRDTDDNGEMYKCWWTNKRG